MIGMILWSSFCVGLGFLLAQGINTWDRRHFKSKEGDFIPMNRIRR